jgi:hypothetical protein
VCSAHLHLQAFLLHIIDNLEYIEMLSRIDIIGLDSRNVSAHCPER